MTESEPKLTPLDATVVIVCPPADLGPEWLPSAPLTVTVTFSTVELFRAFEQAYRDDFSDPRLTAFGEYAAAFQQAAPVSSILTGTPPLTHAGAYAYKSTLDFIAAFGEAVRYAVDVTFEGAHTTGTVALSDAMNDALKTAENHSIPLQMPERAPLSGPRYKEARDRWLKLAKSEVRRLAPKGTGGDDGGGRPRGQRDSPTPLAPLEARVIFGYDSFLRGGDRAKTAADKVSRIKEFAEYFGGTNDPKKKILRLIKRAKTLGLSDADIRRIARTKDPERGTLGQ